MSQNKKDEILHDHNHDGIDRRGFLKCMAWAGTGALCVMQGGVLKSYSMSRANEWNAAKMAGELSFAQISDSHMGFNKAANPDVAATLKAAVDKINGLSVQPEFLVAHGRHQPSGAAGGIRHGRSDFERRCGEGRVFCAGRARRDRRRREAIPRSLREGNAGRGLVQLREEGRAFYRTGERRQSEGGRARQFGRRSAGVAGSRREAFEIEHADCGVRAHSFVVGVSGVGLGHGRQRAGA